MGNDIPESRDLLPETQVSSVIRSLTGPMIHFYCRRLEDARAAYQKVLELDSQHSIALGFLGIVYHLMGNLDKAIIKYHEACLFRSTESRRRC